MPIIPISGSAVAHGALVPIGSTKLLTTTATISFAAIPQGYQDLRLVFSGRSNRTTSDGIGMYFNDGEGGTINTNTYIYGSGAGIYSAVSGAVYTLIRGTLASAAQAPFLFTTTTVDIMNYRSSSFKSLISQTASDFNGSGFIELTASLARITTAVNTITLTSLNSASFVAGTTATLYGVRTAGQ